MRACVFALVAAAVSIGCDPGGSGATFTDVSDASGGGEIDAGSTSNLIEWQPTGVTSAVPAYGTSCRLKAGTFVASASNGSPDDSLSMKIASDGSGTLTIEVDDGSGHVLEVKNISAARGLKDKSFRELAGTGMIGQVTGDVVDGTLCFENKLVAGQNVRAEFTIILQASGGQYYSTGGSFLLPGSTIGQNGDMEIAADTIDIDMR